MQEVFKFENVDKTYYSKKNLFSPQKIETHALKNINFSLKKGETLGIVGESGSGKSTLAKVLLRIEDISSGTVQYLMNGNYKSLRDIKGQESDQFTSEVQMVFQDPYSSLNPMKRIIDSMDIALQAYVKDKKARLENIKEQVGRVNLHEDVLYKYPHELSGGQKQRINIARVLSLKPKVIVFDEATSSLDVSVQASVINLIKAIQKELDLTYIFISHDLSVVDYVSDRVLVFYKGEIVEELEGNILKNAKHEYTKNLIAASPQLSL